ncbi:hypothetical protein QJS66_05265 [Kocuria rhizophila]|nr:hypothetical protein QJS66_05265 [Kocuria rhizophila]
MDPYEWRPGPGGDALAWSGGSCPRPPRAARSRSRRAGGCASRVPWWSRSTSETWLKPCWTRT